MSTGRQGADLFALSGAFCSTFWGTVVSFMASTSFSSTETVICFGFAFIAGSVNNQQPIFVLGGDLVAVHFRQQGQGPHQKLPAPRSLR